MKTAPHRSNEDGCLKTLHSLHVLDTGFEEDLDVMVKIAADACDMPICLISLVDTKRQWFKANVGLPDLTETPREIAFSAHAVLDDRPTEVPDASLDARFVQNPLVTGEPHIRFYTGTPLRLSNGCQIGTLCVFDQKPRVLTSRQRALLLDLSCLIVITLEKRSAMRTTAEAARARLDQLTHHCSDAVVRVDGQGLIQAWNSAAEVLFGYSAIEIIGRPYAVLEPLQQLSPTLEYDTQRTKFFEGSCRCADGRRIFVAQTVSPELYPSNGIPATTHFIRRTDAPLAAGSAQSNSAALQRLASPTMIACWNRELQCQSADRTLECCFDVPSSKLVGRHIADVFGSARFAQEEPLIAAVLEGQPQTVEWTINGEDGLLRHSQVHYVPNLVEGAVVGFWTHIVDVTSLKNVEADLRNEIQKRTAVHAQLKRTTLALEQAQRLGQIGSWEWCSESDTTVWSSQMYQIFGRARESSPPKLAELQKLYTPESWGRLELAVKRAIAASEPFAIELELIRTDGSRCWLDARGETLRNDQGKGIRLRGTAHDISSRKRAELAMLRSQDFLARTGALAGVGGWEVDLQTDGIYWSPEVCALHGEPTTFQPTLEQAISYYTDDSRPILQAAVAIARARGTGFDLELEIVRGDGSRRWVRVVGGAQMANAMAIRLTGAFQDVTERRQMAQALKAQYELVQITLQSIGDAVITTDANALVTWLNPVAERMTGWSAAEASGRPCGQVFTIVDEQTRQPAPSPVESCLRQLAAFESAGENVLLSRSGAEYGIEDSASPIRSMSGKLIGSVLVFHDVTEQRRKSTDQAKHDALTGLVNRQEFEACLRQALDRSLKDHSEHALLFIDLDQFKLVNDACGHSAGDLMLKQVALVLRDCVGGRDTLARLGGDEFAVILERCGKERAHQVAGQICKQLDEFRFIHDGRPFRTGTSIGLVPIDQRWNSISAVMQAADTCCYAAKEAGRNRVHAWSDNDAIVHARHHEMQWASRLEHALDDNRFVLFAQKIIPLEEESHKLHAEVLIRLQDTDGSLVQPGAFLPAAERFHLASRIDSWVLRRVISMLRSRPNLEMIDALCVNLSGQSIGDRVFHEQAMELLIQAGPLVCRCICIEITETVAITNMKDATAFIQQVRELGVRIALDDFGAGASTFGYLKSLVVDKLKIDGQFVTDIVVNALDDVAVRCFVDVARVLRVKTIAEFVDKPEVLTRLREIGVDFAQGFLLHRPAPIEEVILSFDRHPPRSISLTRGQGPEVAPNQ